MISYAQNAEDVILDRAFGSKRSGFYVDVGAASPTEATVTRHFYEAGWNGVNLEPLPDWAAELSVVRPRDVNLAVAAGERPGSFTLFRVVDDPSLSTLSPSVAATHRADGRSIEELIISVVTLDSVLEDLGNPLVDFLKIDVEGAEREVILGIDLEVHRPRVIVVEAVEPYSLVPSFEGFESLILEHRYQLASNDGINRYYVRDEDVDLVPLLVPANAVDDYITMRERLLEDEVTRLRVYIRGLERAIDRSAAPKTDVADLQLPDTTNVVRPHSATPSRPDRSRRIAIVTSPQTGAGVFGTALAELLRVPFLSAEHPADVHWGALPDQLVLEMVWQRTSQFDKRLRTSGFQIATIGRHPFDTLLAILRLTQVDHSTLRWLDGRGGDESPLKGATPNSDAFVSWATGPRARDLIAVTTGWWEDPRTIRLAYEAILDDARAVAKNLVGGEGVQVTSPSTPFDRSATDSAPTLEVVPGGWITYLSPEVVALLTSSYRSELALLGFGRPSMPGDVDPAVLDALWTTATSTIT
ncbi:MAG TPA: FkbM family methyltransferase [Acidimicrobiales bacterium]|nr:FkbM family methyltransferase [Acidimicrobiales bacterium]